MDKVRITPLNGVYVTNIVIDTIRFNSITNVGNNPTFEEDNHSIMVETNVFDFDKDIYGNNVKVSFLKFIRNEKKFASANELIEQIKKDVEIAQGYHGKYR